VAKVRRDASAALSLSTEKKQRKQLATEDFEIKRNDGTEPMARRF